VLWENKATGVRAEWHVAAPHWRVIDSDGSLFQQCNSEGEAKWHAYGRCLVRSNGLLLWHDVETAACARYQQVAPHWWAGIGNNWTSCDNAENAIAAAQRMAQERRDEKRAASPAQTSEPKPKPPQKSEATFEDIMRAARPERPPTIGAVDRKAQPWRDRLPVFEAVILKKDTDLISDYMMAAKPLPKGLLGGTEVTQAIEAFTEALHLEGDSLRAARELIIEHRRDNARKLLADGDLMCSRCRGTGTGWSGRVKTKKADGAVVDLVICPSCEFFTSPYKKTMCVLCGGMSELPNGWKKIKLGPGKDEADICLFCLDAINNGASASEYKKTNCALCGGLSGQPKGWKKVSLGSGKSEADVCLLCLDRIEATLPVSDALPQTARDTRGSAQGKPCRA
jgi:hypothetical protein